jgi:hypothetical protein
MSPLLGFSVWFVLHSRAIQGGLSPPVFAPEDEPVLVTLAGVSDEHGPAIWWPTIMPVAFRSRVATRGDRMSKQELRSPAALSILVATQISQLHGRRQKCAECRDPWSS